jgi:hypothetical protein
MLRFIVLGYIAFASATPHANRPSSILQHIIVNGHDLISICRLAQLTAFHFYQAAELDIAFALTSRPLCRTLRPRWAL